MLFHLQEATLSTPTWAEFETTSLLKIVSKVSIASTFAGEGSSLAEHQEVTSPTQRHEEKKKRSIIENQPPSTPKFLSAIKLVRTSWINIGSKPRRRWVTLV
jgi:hypothetical protein